MVVEVAALYFFFNILLGKGGPNLLLLGEPNLLLFFCLFVCFFTSLDSALCIKLQNESCAIRKHRQRGEG